jgi:hypothetical protein
MSRHKKKIRNTKLDSTALAVFGGGLAIVVLMLVFLT